MYDFIREYNGDFIYISTEIFPMTCFMFNNRDILKKEEFYDLDEYVSGLIKTLDLGQENVKLFKNNLSDVLELVMNEKGIHKIALKGKYYGL